MLRWAAFPLERVPDQVGLIAQPKLSHEICAVALDGADADRQSLGNLRVGVALGRQVEHISLPARQGLVALRRAGRRPPLDNLPFPRSLCDGKVMIPRYVEHLGRSAHDERIAAQDDQGFPGEGVVERSVRTRRSASTAFGGARRRSQWLSPRCSLEPMLAPVSRSIYGRLARAKTCPGGDTTSGSIQSRCSRPPGIDQRRADAGAAPSGPSPRSGVPGRARSRTPCSPGRP